MNDNRIYLRGKIFSEKDKDENGNRTDSGGKPAQNGDIFTAHPYAEKGGGYIHAEQQRDRVMQNV